MYNEFSTANIQIDKDFSAKLSGYGCVGHIPEAEISTNSVVSSLTSFTVMTFPVELLFFKLCIQVRANLSLLSLICLNK